MNEWKLYSEADYEVRSCYHDQITNPGLGETVIQIGSLQDSIVLFWFDEPHRMPMKYMQVPRP